MIKTMNDLIHADWSMWEANCEGIREALEVIAQAFNECAKQIKSIEFKENNENYNRIN